MRLFEKLKEKTKHTAEEAKPEDSVKSKAGSEHGFLDAIKEEISAPKSGESPQHEVTVEEVYQDLAQRRRKGEMPRDPREALMDALGTPSASEVFASGAVFDLSRQYRDHFIKALQGSDTRKLSELFRASFSMFMDQPEAIGLTESMFNKKNVDTDPMTWVVSSSAAPNGDPIALCCMPVQNKALSARFVGIVFSDSGDGYYFSMVNKDEKTPSAVMRRAGKLPPVKAGEIRGTASEATDRFLDCIRRRQEMETGNTESISDFI